MDDVNELKNHKHIVEFLNIFGFESWDDVRDVTLDFEKLEADGCLEKFEKYGLKYKLRDVLPVKQIPKLRKCDTVDTISHLITLLKSVLRYFGVEAENKIIKKKILRIV